MTVLLESSELVFANMYSKYGCGDAGNGLSTETLAVVGDLRAFAEERPLAAVWIAATLVLAETEQVREARGTFVFLSVMSHSLGRTNRCSCH